MDEGQSLFLSSQGLRLPANFHSAGSRACAIVMSHGLESTKDSTKWREFASLLLEQGISGLRFTHRGCGGGDEPTADGLMEETTLSGRITDFQTALAFLRATDIDQARIGAVGSSFGGMVVLAAQDPRVRALALLATPYLLPEEIPHMPALGTDAAQYDLLEALQRCRCPVLIVHGDADEVVPLEHALRLYESAQEPKGLEVISGADHMFSHPEHRRRALDLCLGWMQTYL